MLNKGGCMEALINWLEDEIQRHKDRENSEVTPWGRGFENGSLTEAIILKIKIRQLIKEDKVC